MKVRIKYLIISVSLICISIPSYFYIQYQLLPIYQIEYNAGEEMIDGTPYAIHYVNFKNRSYKSVNPLVDVDDYPLGKLIGGTENGIETVFAVKGHKDLIAVSGFMMVPTYFKETKDLD
ncbi:hypothetical protein D1B31_01130 [Neobacillus notoginsengisoli]|uniref:Uncharacterized protein n=1 Tax=Neobacillus notoginsengisoli TaxID=1578198 RepID=A0A417YZX0_9BACI|nr:hypothetical protein [Neobacillus notoginsengisoli]RHW43304.1 hypothetical protein D1B31_01130 [Neobacillus notoginsengisoli]